MHYAFIDLSIKQIAHELALRLAGGPLRFRLILQPIVAMSLGIRDGLRDASAGAPPFLHCSLDWEGKLRQIVGRLWHPILFATIIDAIEQFLMFEHVRPLTAIVMGSALMTLPYLTARGLSNRIRSGWRRHSYRRMPT